MTDAGDNKGESKVDESLYSRQLYVFGHEAQRRMAETNVLIVGLKGLGAEIGAFCAAPFAIFFCGFPVRRAA